jgi:hypothetical protein
MKTCVVYHEVDLDGWMSAAIVKYWWENSPNAIDNNNDKLDFIGYNYGQPIPDLSEYDKVIMCDISFPKDIMYLEANCSDRELIWIDHHISAISDSKIDKFYQYDKTKGLRDNNFAACELTWKYFFPNEPMPEIVRLLGRYDCFGHKGTDEETKVLEFQYGARQCISNYEEAYKNLEFSLMFNIINSILHKGKSIYQYLCTEAKQAYKNGFDLSFRFSPKIPEHSALGFTEEDIYRFVCINKERFNPINFGIDYHKDGYDGTACFHYNGETKKWHFSLYNDNNKVDCSKIAKQYGGGGHKGASGFVVDDISNFLNLINK